MKLNILAFAVALALATNLFAQPSGMALIPAGSFTMGDSLDNGSALPLHSVYVSAFYMDQYDVTLALWQQVYNWATNHGYRFDNAGLGKATNHPVVSVNWYDCVKWCNARGEMEGRIPAYYTTAAQTVVYQSGELDISNSCVNWNAGYRLPTEAEWEKAARGGLSGLRFPWGNTISWSQANYDGDTNDYTYDLGPNGGNPIFDDGVWLLTSPVNYFAPNRYGLYDMAGNVWQWCWDWYGDYSSAAQTDPRGPTSGLIGYYGSVRVFRGGWWGQFAFNCRSAYRFFDDYGLLHGYYFGCGPAQGVDSLGFRSVLPPSGQPAITVQPLSQTAQVGSNVSL